MKNILFIASEAVPFIKTGGLADVAGSLPKYFDKRYFDIRVILPKYACMKQEWKDKMDFVKYTISSCLGILIWNLVFVGAGYFFGEAAIRVLA